jgi:hypothetical protein
MSSGAVHVVHAASLIATLFCHFNTLLFKCNVCLYFGRILENVTLVNPEVEGKAGGNLSLCQIFSTRQFILVVFYHQMHKTFRSRAIEEKSSRTQTETCKLAASVFLCTCKVYQTTVYTKIPSERVVSCTITATFLLPFPKHQSIPSNSSKKLYSLLIIFK